VKAIARGNASTALTLNMHSALCRIVSIVATPEQQERYFRRAVSDRGLFASLGSEPAASFNREKVISSVPTLEGDVYRLTTTKHFCSLSSVASDLFVWVNLPDSSFDDGYYCLAIDATSPGVEVDRTWDTMALRSTESQTVRFDDVAVPAGNRIGEPGDFMKHGLHSAFVLGYSAVYLGVAEAAYEFAHHYAATKSFPADPRPICHEAKVSARVASMSVALEAADLLMRRAARSFETGTKEERTLALDQSKYFVGETALSVTDSALQVVGGRGIMRSSTLERHLRDARAAAVMPPSGDRCLEVLGQLLFDIDE
jgi:alkylation response protein AidB-like acyl-CoA dehydrogenase